MPFPAFRCLHPKRAVALLGHQASGETALQKYRHAGTLKQAGLGVWGMRQHGESTRSCERPPPRQGHKKKKFRGRDHSAQLVELCFLSIAERFMSGGESLCRRRALIQDLWSLWITLNIIDTITCPLGLPSPLEGLGLGVNPDARGGRHTSSARTARFGVPPSRVARRRPGRRRCRFPLSAACTRSALWRS